MFGQSQQRSAGALAVSFGIHAAIVGLAVWVATRPPAGPISSDFVDRVSNQIVWLAADGPGGGGGGGGNERPEPIRKAALKGEDEITVPVQKLLAVEQPKPEPPESPVQNLIIPAQTLASADLVHVGAIEGIPASESLGPGRNGGAGDGRDGGIGPGDGPGLGPGYGGNTGGESFRPGNGVEKPRLLHELKPQYTAPAMRAKIQGEVLLECVVQTDGTVGNIRVARSLDSVFGLDQEAIKAARQWRFAPGTRRGEPVPVLVTIAIAFALR